MWNGSAWKLEGLLGPRGILVMWDRRILNKEDRWIGHFCALPIRYCGGCFLMVIFSVCGLSMFSGKTGERCNKNQEVSRRGR